MTLRIDAMPDAGHRGSVRETSLLAKGGYSSYAEKNNCDRTDLMSTSGKMSAEISSGEGLLLSPGGQDTELLHTSP